MGDSVVYQGAWQAQVYQGAWQIQAQEFQDTLADVISFADVEQTADSRVINAGTEDSGSLSDTYTQNSVYYQIGETGGTPGTQIEFTFSVNGIARSFTIYGRYQGNPAHNVQVEAYNGSTWDVLSGTWSHAVADHLQTWTLQASHTVTGSVQIRVNHTSPGNPTHDFYFDHVYVTDGADSVVGVLSASISESDGVSITDQLAASAIIAIADTISLTDNIVVAASKALSETITLIDDSGVGYFDTLADSIGMVDNVTLAVAKEIAETLNLTDIVSELASSPQSDSISLVDSVSGIIGKFFNDTVAISEQVTALASVLTEDTITLSDNVSGDLGSGIEAAVASSASDTLKGARIGNQNWTKEVSNTPSPITSFSVSSENTTFTTLGVTDSSLWDLSDANEGDLISTGDGYSAVIKSIGVNSVVISGWIKGGINRLGTASDKPTDGNRVTIHKMVKVKRLMIRASESNDDYVYVGVGEPDVDPDSGHPVSPNVTHVNSQLVLDAQEGEWLNVSNIWVVSGHSQEVIVSPGINYLEGGAGRATSLGLSDSIGGISDSGDTYFNFATIPPANDQNDVVINEDVSVVIGGSPVPRNQMAVIGDLTVSPVTYVSPDPGSKIAIWESETEIWWCITDHALQPDPSFGNVLFHSDKPVYVYDPIDYVSLPSGRSEWGDLIFLDAEPTWLNRVGCTVSNNRKPIQFYRDSSNDTYMTYLDIIIMTYPSPTQQLYSIDHSHNTGAIVNPALCANIKAFYVVNIGTGSVKMVLESQPPDTLWWNGTTFVLAGLSQYAQGVTAAPEYGDVGSRIVYSQRNVLTNEIEGYFNIPYRYSCTHY
ncbi:MAG: hypothetical protein ACW987_04825 [Candidatus Thorarchaeota archaeon]|jgi:hypothetical protein